MFVGKLSLCLIKHHTLYTHCGMEEYFHKFFTSGLDRVFGSRPGRLDPVTHWVGGWVVSRPGLEAVDKWESTTPASS